jgi:transposase-like protein
MNIVRIYQLFPTEADCITHLEKVRWHATPICPYCKSDRVSAMPVEQRHHCNNCKTSFSVTVGTIFHHTHLPLQKWFLAVALVLNAKKGLSARQLARDLEVNKNTGWRMAMQIRKAMEQRDQRDLLSGMIEMDETYVGGKPRKGNTGSGGQGGGNKSSRGRGTKKRAVVGMIERGGRVRAQVATKKNLRAKGLSSLVRSNIDIANSTLITDEYGGYIGIKSFMPHKTVNHSIWYVADDGSHTNSIESFWALLKRGIVGQYHKVSLRHLPAYINEFSYRFNHRNNANVFDLTIERAIGVTR